MSENASALTIWLEYAAAGALFGLICLYFYCLGVIVKADFEGKEVPRWLTVAYFSGPTQNGPVPWAGVFFMSVSALGVLGSLWLFRDSRVAQLFLLVTYIVPALMLNRYSRKWKSRGQKPA